jgi:hypothetical protein
LHERRADRLEGPPEWDLYASILRGIVAAIGPDGAVAVRFEHRETINDLSVSRLLMTPEHAETIGRELIQTAQLARKAADEA